MKTLFPVLFSNVLLPSVAVGGLRNKLIIGTSSLCRAVLILGIVSANSQPMADKLGEVTARSLNIRAAPSTEAPVVGGLKRGEQVVLRPVSDGWAEIVVGTGARGYVSRKWIKVIGTTVPARKRDANRSSTPHSGVKHENTYETSSEGVGGLLIVATVFIGLIIYVFSRLSRRDRARGAAETHGWSPTSQRDRERANDFHEPRSHDRQAHVAQLPSVKVDYVIDGDTVIVKKSWRRITIRLDAIDCPEDGQPWGEIATAGLIKLIGGKSVRIEEHGQDRYGRTLGTLYVQNHHNSLWTNVNEKMVAKGHAWVLRRYWDHLPEHRKARLSRLEWWARAKKVGLWNTPNPVPPWRWRRTVLSGKTPGD